MEARSPCDLRGGLVPATPNPDRVCSLRSEPLGGDEYHPVPLRIRCVPLPEKHSDYGSHGDCSPRPFRTRIADQGTHGSPTDPAAADRLLLESRIPLRGHQAKLETLCSDP